MRTICGSEPPSEVLGRRGRQEGRGPIPACRNQPNVKPCEGEENAHLLQRCFLMRSSGDLYTPARIARAASINRTPIGALIRFPHGTFFSIAIIVPRPSIHKKWVVTAANISNISDQQHPMQNRPW